MRHSVPTLLLLLAACHSYPTTAEVDAALLRAQVGSPQERRAEFLKLLRRLRATDSVSDDATLRYALRRLSETYRASPDDELLAAVDATTIDGGYANEVCEFYRSVLPVPAAQSRYRAARKGVDRCRGIAFGEKELGQLLDAH